MPLTIPTLEARSYQDFLSDALARIATHNPEWTNYNRSDPGVTLLELFAFLAENLAYRANLIPERNRRAFLSLLGIPLKPASPAQGIVTLSNERGPLETIPLNGGLEVRAGQVPFLTEQGLDVLPVEARAFVKLALAPSAEILESYAIQYAAMAPPGASPATFSSTLRLYQTVTLDSLAPDGVDLVHETVDGSLWLALVARPGDKDLSAVREALSNRTLSLGIVPVIDEPLANLPPAGTEAAPTETYLDFVIPKAPGSVTGARQPAQYQSLSARTTTNVLVEPGVVQVSLPDQSAIVVFDSLEPIEEGVGDLPPALEDTDLAARVVTWVRVRAQRAQQAKMLWAGINSTQVRQRGHVANEVLPDGTGEPDQIVQLTKTPVLPGSLRLTVTVFDANPSGPGRTELWRPIEDLYLAGPEVPVPDLRQPPGTFAPPPGPTDVFLLDPESGVIRFGDGLHGRRPPAGAQLRASYDNAMGRAGNVGPRSIKSGPALPAGLKVANPIRTWGGADSENVSEGEKQIARYLQHRDRLVTERDFQTITRRAPGVEVARIDVLSAYNPELRVNYPGDAPGAVTLLLVPMHDQASPAAPQPDKFFLDSVCRYLEPRRLVTTELFLRGPDYIPIWISAGIEFVPGESVSEVQERVRSELSQFLSPLPQIAQPLTENSTLAIYPHADSGWPLRKAVVRLELMAMASRVQGVLLVNSILVARGAGPEQDRIEIEGLELPRVAGIMVVPGDAGPLAQLRGSGSPPAGPHDVLPVPFVPASC